MLDGFANSLKNMIFEQDKTPQPETATAVPVKASQSAPVPSLDASNKYVGLLRQAMQQRPTALTALTNAAEKLEGVIPDRSMRIKAAFQMVKSDGRGVKELLDAITIHVADLESQRLQFSRAMETESATAIGTLESEASTLAFNTKSAQDQILQLQSQLNGLTNIINENNTKAFEITNKIAGEKNRLDQNARQFDVALQIVKGELEGQRTVIQSALS